MLLWTVLAIAIVLADQISKILVVQNISAVDTIHVIPHLFDFVYVRNTGAAFSFLADNTVLLSVVSVIFCAGVVVYWVYKKPNSRLLKTALTLLFAGAFGNAVDRIFRGYVIDFISTSFIKFPVFNIADIAIVAGAALLIVYFILSDGKEEKNEDNIISGGEK